MTIKAASFFAGVGGIDLAFMYNDVDIVYANEFNNFAVQTYEANFDLKVDNNDIRNVQGKDIPKCDIFIGGFPCQPFSWNGKYEGFKDSKGRGNLVFELCRLIYAKKPKAIFLENVEGLVYHNKGETLKAIIEYLNDLNYAVTWKVMDAAEYGNIPQHRSRIYIVAFKNKKRFKKFKFPEKILLTRTIDEFVDFEKPVDSIYYYTYERFKSFYEKIIETVVETNSIYRYDRKKIVQKKDAICFCLLASMCSSYSAPMIKTYNGEIRRLTPREFFNLQGFPEDFIFPEKMSNTQLYQQAGNSVCIPVVARIANNIVKVLTS